MNREIARHAQRIVTYSGPACWSRAASENAGQNRRAMLHDKRKRSLQWRFAWQLLPAALSAVR